MTQTINHNHVKLGQVAALLGAGWDYQPDEMSYSTGGRFTGPDGVALYVGIDRYHSKGKFNIGGFYGPLSGFLRHLSSSWQGNNFVKEDRGDSINVSMEKRPEQIARDIQRRLLDVVIRETKIARENQARTHAAQTARYAAMQRVADALHAKIRKDERKAQDGDDNPEISYHAVHKLHAYATTNHAGDRFEMKISGLTTEQAEYLAQIINSPHFGTIGPA